MFYSFQTKLMTDLKSMAIVPMHEWKVPLKYRAMLLFPSACGLLGLGGTADTMVWGGVPTKWREQKSTSTYILKLRRNSTGVPYYVTESSSSRCHCHCHCRCSPLATTTTTVTPWLHRCRLVIVTAVTTVSPPPLL
jgi:hypothetical protein